MKSTRADLRNRAQRRPFAAEEASQANLSGQAKSKTEHEALAWADKLCRASHNPKYEPFGRVQLDLIEPALRGVLAAYTPTQ